MMPEENIEDLDDPIKLFDCRNLLDAGIIETECSERAVVQSNLKYKLSLKSCYMLPVSFFDIPRNIVLLNECQPIRVRIVDVKKHPWYFKYNIRQSSKSNKIDNTNHFDSEDDFDIICLGPIDNSDITPPKLPDANRDTEIIDLTSNKSSANILTKWRKSVDGKLDLELRKAQSQKRTTDIDFKRNKGLIGIKITRRVTVDDIAQDANNNVKSNNDLRNEVENKDNQTKNYAETYVKAVDKVLERVGTVITPILKDRNGYVTNNVNSNQLESNPPIDGNNNPNIQCLSKAPSQIPKKYVQIKESTIPEVKEIIEQTAINKSTKHILEENEEKCMTLFNRVHIMGSKLNNDLKSSEISSSFNLKKYEKTSFSHDTTKFHHKTEQPKERPMPKCKKLLKNIKSKSKEVKVKSNDSDKPYKQNARQISGIISPILACNTVSKESNLLKTSSKPNFINEPKGSISSRSVFETHKNNTKQYGNKKKININNNPKFKKPQQNSKLSYGEDLKYEIKVNKSLQLNNNESTPIQNNETAASKDYSENAQKLLQSIVNHEFSTPLESNKTAVRKKSIPKMSEKVDSIQQVPITGTSELQTNPKDKPATTLALKSDLKENRPNSEVKKLNIISSENVRDSNITNNFITAAQQQNMQSDADKLNSAVEKVESIVLQRPIRTKTPYQLNGVSENILDVNPRNNIATNIPVINNKASAIILRPQLKAFRTFNLNGQPIQAYTTCRSQYPAITKYPTLDKLLSKTSSQAMYQVPHLPPNRHYLQPNQNVYKQRNFMRHSPPYYGVSPSIAPVAGPVLPNMFGAPKPNPYWNCERPPLIPPPPPPPPPPPSLPVRANHNPNILTDIQPNDDSSTIGRNIKGLVKKINIINTLTQQLEHDSKEVVVKLENTSPQNASEITPNRSGGVLKTVSGLISEKPVGTKSEMLAELERSMLEKSPERTDLKRPHFRNKPVSTDPVRLQSMVHKVELGKSMFAKSPEKTNIKRPHFENKPVSTGPVRLRHMVSKAGPLSKKMKPALLPTPSTEQTVTMPNNGYSPPILPIPTYQNFLSHVNATIPNNILEKPKDDILKNRVIPFIRNASRTNVKPCPKKAKKRLCYNEEYLTKETPAKKISIEDYKKRSNSDCNFVLTAHRMKQNGNNSAKSLLKVHSKNKCNNSSSNLDMQDLGYNSDTHVKP